MNRYISFIIATIVGISASAYELADSTSTYTTASADSVIIRQSDDGVSVTIINKDATGTKDMTFSQPSEGKMLIKTSIRRPYRSLLNQQDDTCSTSSWFTTLGGLMLGFNSGFGAPAGLDIEMGKSFEIGLMNVIGECYSIPKYNAGLIIGLGINWRNYRMTTPVQFIPTDDGVGFGGIPEGVNFESSRLKIFSLTLPITFKQLITKGHGRYNLGYFLGPIINYNVHGSLLNKYRDLKGNAFQVGCNKIHQRKFTIDAMAGLGFGLVSLYVKYSPMKVLGPNCPQFTPFSTGVMLVF